MSSSKPLNKLQNKKYMENILLFIFDFILILPITLIRLVLIYLFGSKYNLPSFGFFDVMMHANNKYFNQEDIDPSIDTLYDDIRVRINYDSRCNKDLIVINNNKNCSTCKELLQIIENNKIESIISNNKHNIESDHLEERNMVDKSCQANKPQFKRDENNSNSIFTKKTNRAKIYDDTDTDTLNANSENESTIAFDEKDIVRTENNYAEINYNKNNISVDDLNENRQKLLIFLDKIGNK